VHAGIFTVQLKVNLRGGIDMQDKAGIIKVKRNPEGDITDVTIKQ